MTQVSTTKELPSTGLVRLSQFKGIVSISSVTVWRLLNDGKFPAPLRVSTRLRLWRVEDIREWMRVGPDAWLVAHPVAEVESAA